MAPGPWTGESSSSITWSMNPRDSRVVSIYEKYLYDPKDLESSDPRRRELARKASQLKLHGRPANIMDANGVRRAGAPGGLTRGRNLPQRKSIAFTQGTKHTDGRTASSALASHLQPSSKPAAASDQDDGTFDLGLGMLGSDDSDTDSDTDDDHSAPPTFSMVHKNSSPIRPDSWTDRAAAVGQRPPDSASQNPPSLKLMALKSSNKNSADALGASGYGQQARLTANSNPVDRTSRHGSTIGFAGPPSDILDHPHTQASFIHQKRLSARTALTTQLGLTGPNPASSAESGYQQSNHLASLQQGQPQHYINPTAPSQGNAPSPSRNIPLAPIDVNRAQQHSFFGDASNDRATPSPMGSQYSYPSSPNSATPLRSPSYDTPGMRTTHHPSPHYGGMQPPNVLQRGPPGLHNAQSMAVPGQRQPGPVTPQNHFGNTPPSGVDSRKGKGPTDVSAPSRGGPTAAMNTGLPFSDAPGPPKRQSLFRRSMAMFGGSGVGPQGGQPNSRDGNRGAYVDAQSRQAGGAPKRRQSLFRRSMALLNGNGNGFGTSQNAKPNAPSATVAADGASVPRVKALQEDYEKPDHPRKSQFLGAGGSGVEWDTQGEGAKFWRRFSMAQKTAHTHKIDDGSKAWMKSMAAGKRKLIVMSVIGLLTLVGVIVGVIVWREIVSPSGSTSSQPSSIFKANLGTMGDDNSTAASGAGQFAAAATVSASSDADFYARSLSTDSVMDAALHRHRRAHLDNSLVNAPRWRRQALGRDPTANVKERSLKQID